MPQGNGHRLGAFQSRLAQASSGKSRSEIADQAGRVAASAWGPEAPEIDEVLIRRLQVEMRNPPADGRSMRAVLSALGVPLVEALALMDYWPDLSLGTTRPVSPEQLLVAACQMVGLEARVRSAGAGRLIVEL